MANENKEDHLSSTVPTPPLFACSQHGHCNPSKTVSDLADSAPCCSRCPDYLARDPFGPNSMQMCLKANAYLAGLPDYPEGRYHDRGVVIAGGGDRFLPSLYVTIRALRHLGCQLPIQVWYLGRHDEMPQARQALLTPYQVQCVDGDAVRLFHPARRLDGWELKVFAILHSPFEEVLFLDADCYPCRNPDFVFHLEDYRSRGAIFWPDLPVYDLRIKWPAFTVPNPHRPGSVESGQLVIHKKLTWHSLNLTWFYNDHSDYYYQFCYGDKHTFEVVWTRAGQLFVMWYPQATWAEVAFLHFGPDGLPLFVHRCSDKFRFNSQQYVTPQSHQLPQFHSQLPLERECWAWMRELAQLLGYTPDFLFMPE